MKNYKKLQNGSDIRGIAITGVPGELPNLRPEEAADIAEGFLIWLCKKLGKDPQDLTLAIGRDPRVSGKLLLDGLMDGFGPYGVKVYDCGLASTPAMFMATRFPEFRCDGTVMITASHLPYNRNGFKFFTAEGGLDKKDISQILAYAEEESAGMTHLGEPGNKDGSVLRLGKRVFEAEKADLMTPYCDHLKQLILDGAGAGEKPLAGMKIVVDAGNGGGGFFAKEVLKPLGADISASQYLEPDGMFSNHAPNPEDKDAMNAISMQVLSKGADFGIIFDTDVDRSAAVDGRGREIARNGIVAMAAALIAEDHPGTTVVTDSITSRQLTEFLEGDLKLKHLRFKRGYKNVINKAKELNEQGIDCQLAIETSGHAALKENFFLDDGAYLATKIVIKAARLKAEGKTLDSVIEKLREPADEKEIRIPVTCEDFGAYGEKVLEDLKIFAEGAEDLSMEEPNYEGVRINFPKGWCLLRKSLHDPILPMNMASDEAGGCSEIKERMAEFLKDYEGLDLSVMK
ncbi:MAG: phosphomannomutase/phosphoglucomutase [Bacillota bacterium]|nr:phosphomannomutase/phosphoglucomutase [Bacillota bacterium]